VEAEPDVVPDPARAQRGERRLDHRPRRGVARASMHLQERVVGGVGELRRAPDAPDRGVDGRRQLLARARERPGTGAARARRGRRRGDVARQVLGGAHGLLAARAPDLGEVGQELEQALAAEACLLREVRAREEGLAVGSQDDGHRPAARAGQGLRRPHVHVVDVGTLLAVDLDAHEVSVQEPRHLLVLEGLLLHHVAPVAGRVADREEDRLLLAARALERRGAPRIPVDGVLRVLEQVRARLEDEPVELAAAVLRQGGDLLRRGERRSRSLRGSGSVLLARPCGERETGEERRQGEREVLHGGRGPLGAEERH
jgi:hypothetical protein